MINESFKKLAPSTQKMLTQAFNRGESFVAIDEAGKVFVAVHSDLTVSSKYKIKETKGAWCAGEVNYG